MKLKSGNFGLRPFAKLSSFLRMFPVFLLPVVALILAAFAPGYQAQNEIPFSTAKIIIEFNTSGNDVGAQVLLDGEPWKWIKIKSPEGNKILDIKNKGSLKKQGLTELFFESSEPSLDEVPLAEFLDRFPEGEYDFKGQTIEGDDLAGKATFTHVIPAGPVIISPQEGAEVDLDNLVISWQPVTGKIAGSGNLVIVGYQVVVDGGNPTRRFDITLSAATLNVKVPPEFLEPGTEYTFEVLVIEAGGNQTIREGSFATAP